MSDHSGVIMGDSNTENQSFPYIRECTRMDHTNVECTSRTTTPSTNKALLVNEAVATMALPDVIPQENVSKDK